MSDNEDGGKKSGYRLDYATSNRSKCKGPKPCSGTTITKGEMRVGSLVDFRGHTSFAWRHWGCTTPKIITNMKASFEDADGLDGFEDLNEDDQEKIRKAWEAGHVADEDIPDSARKPEGDGDEEEDEDGEAKPKKKAAAKSPKKDEGDAKGKFHLEYAASGRAKCKECKESIGKGYFRLGSEVDFRGNKSIAWQHWGHVTTKMFAKLKNSYEDVESIEGFDTLQDADKERVRHAWQEGDIPEDDKDIGEPIETGKKKAPAKKGKKAEAEEDRPKKRARKAKDEDEEEEELEEEEEKPKRKAVAKKAAEKPVAKKAPAKKRASKKKVEDEESGEDFGDEIANVSEDEEEPEEDSSSSKKRKRAPASSAKASSSKPASSSKQPSKPASKRAAKPSSSRAKKQAPVEEESDEE